MVNPRFNVSLLEASEQWSIDDMADAHDLIEAFDNAQREANKQ